MIGRSPRYIAVAAGLLAIGCSAAPAVPPAKLRIGVTAHFAQGWPDVLWHALGSVHARTVREAISWRRVEARSGQYDFTAQNSGHLNRLCAMKLPVVLVIDPRNPLYDGGMTADTAQAQAAFGAFVAAVADRFGTCLAAIEVGNEINGAKAMTGAAASHRADSHTRLMKAVWQVVKPRHPQVALLGGSVNTVGTGFLQALFAHGLLDWVDGLAIHPYRRSVEGLDWELAALNAAMARQGKVKPLWATEFGIATSDWHVASDYLLSMAVMMSAAGISEAQWYALADDSSFPTMGLVQSDASAKPAARTFALLAEDLLVRGPAVRIDAQDPGLFRYRFGNDREVIWGAPRAIAVPAGAVVRDSAGRRLEGTIRIGPSPIIVESGGEIQIGSTEVLADSLYDYATPVWSYAAGSSAAGLTGLRTVHSNFASSLGAPGHAPVAVNPGGMILPAGQRQMMVSLRYDLRRALRIVVQACLAPRSATSGTAEFSVATSRETIAPQPIPPGGLQFAREFSLAAGDSVNFIASARGGPAVLGHRFRIAVAGTPAARETLRCN